MIRIVQIVPQCDPAEDPDNVLEDVLDTIANTIEVALRLIARTTIIPGVDAQTIEVSIRQAMHHEEPITYYLGVDHDGDLRDVEMEQMEQIRALYQEAKSAVASALPTKMFGEMR